MKLRVKMNKMFNIFCRKSNEVGSNDDKCSAAETNKMLSCYKKNYIRVFALRQRRLGVYREIIWRFSLQTPHWFIVGRVWRTGWTVSGHCFRELLFEIQVSMSCRFNVGGRCFFCRCRQGEKPRLWDRCNSVWCVKPTLCRRLLLNGPVAASDVVPAWNVCWCSFLWVSSKRYCIGTLGFLLHCLACWHSYVTIFMGKPLLLSQLQSLSEVLAEAFHSIQRRWGFTGNTHTKKTHFRHGWWFHLKYIISTLPTTSRHGLSRIQSHVLISTHNVNTRQNDSASTAEMWQQILKAAVLRFHLSSGWARLKLNSKLMSFRVLGNVTSLNRNTKWMGHQIFLTFRS